MKILAVVGTRPNFIKMSPVIKEIEKRGIDYILVHTGQHYDKEMSSVFLDELQLKNTFDLEVGSGTHGYQTGEMLIRIEKIMMNESPSIVLVPGDTNTSLAGALAAVKLHTPIGHVESGLRSFDKRMPEEINRILIDHCSDYLFCPTETAVRNLKNEGFSDKDLFLVGDTNFDACLQNLEIARKKSRIFSQYPIDSDFFLATIHRVENTDNATNLRNIVEAFRLIETQIVFPVHPRTMKRLIEYELFDKIKKKKNILITKPLGYLDFLMLLSKAKMVLTDSGGVQKEAFFLKIPCLTLRENTEWKETTNLGWNMLTKVKKEKIIESISSTMRMPKKSGNPFGDGLASKKIIDVIEKAFL